VRLRRRRTTTRRRRRRRRRRRSRRRSEEEEEELASLLHRHLGNTRPEPDLEVPLQRILHFVTELVNRDVVFACDCLLKVIPVPQRQDRTRNVLQQPFA
jgi:hypothetical protein